MEAVALALPQLQGLEAVKEARGHGELRIGLVDSSHTNLRTLWAPATELKGLVFSEKISS